MRSIPHGLFLAAIPLLGGCATAPSVPALAREVALENAGFELPAEADRNCAVRWGCSVHADPSAFRFAVDATIASEGKQSLRIEPAGKEPWAVAAQVVRDLRLRGTRLRLSFAMKTEGVTGKGAGPWVEVQDGYGRRMSNHTEYATGTQDWARRSIEFVVPAGMYQFEVGTILDGQGKVWIDDFRLEVLEVDSSQKKPV